MTRVARILCVALGLLAGSLVTGCRGQPQNYDDCILLYVKSGMDTAAVGVVTRSCRAKFPVEQNDIAKVAGQRQLTQAEIGALTGRAGLSFGTYYGGSIYNGNANLTITQLEITVATKISREDVSRVYRVDVSIPPSTTSTFGFNIIVGDESAPYTWFISAARGKPAQ